MLKKGFVKTRFIAPDTVELVFEHICCWGSSKGHHTEKKHDLVYPSLEQLEYGLSIANKGIQVEAETDSFAAWKDGKNEWVSCFRLHIPESFKLNQRRVAEDKLFHEVGTDDKRRMLTEKLKNLSNLTNCKGDVRKLYSPSDIISKLYEFTDDAPLEYIKREFLKYFNA